MDRRPLPVRAPEREPAPASRRCAQRRVVLRRAPGFRVAPCVRAVGEVLRLSPGRRLSIALRTRVTGGCTLAVVHAELAELLVERLYGCGLTATIERA